MNLQNECKRLTEELISCGSGSARINFGASGRKNFDLIPKKKMKGNSSQNNISSSTPYNKTGKSDRPSLLKPLASTKNSRRTSLHYNYENTETPQKLKEALDHAESHLAELTSSWHSEKQQM